ncbi:hypothetical protein [Rhodococcoides fascians]|uniref:hypothetical protein n=1 Tax=Rhodococcoides fascians TaxID=1828 RepID=UPI001C5301AF|nr:MULTISPECIES: hypothetical protein [Rhodococcus]
MTGDSKHYEAILRAAQAMDTVSAMFWKLSATRLHGPRGAARLNEPAFTELLLLLLEGHQVLQQYQFTGGQESAVGADWEWWIGADDLGWRCARIQAKRVFPRIDTASRPIPDGVPLYKQLDHTVGRTGGPLQMDVLINGANLGVDPDTKKPDRDLVGVLDPYYVFFNGWPERTFSRESISDVDVAQADELRVAINAMIRTDQPAWGDWAVRRLQHQMFCGTCPPPPGRVTKQHENAAPVTHLSRLTREQLQYWGVSAMPALTVRNEYRRTSDVSVMPYLAQSLPLSTILFDQWMVLSHQLGPDRRVRSALPPYADAVRNFGGGEDGVANALGWLSNFDEQRGFGVSRVAVTDIGIYTNQQQVRR